MLSTAASNALLKTIEEPPLKVVFILATTNPERVINTIQSRCQKFDFKRINSNIIFHHLTDIATKESIKFESQALRLIAKRSNGGMRDAQSLLDQLSLMPNGITIKNVQNLLGEVSENDLINLINALINNDPKSLLISCNDLYDSGNEAHEILVGLLNITRDLLLQTINNDYSDIFYTSIDFQKQLNELSNNINKSRIIDWHKKLKNIDYQIKTSDNPRLWLEIHLTSLLDNDEPKHTNIRIKSNQAGVNQKTTNNKKLINKEVYTENIKNQNQSETPNNTELIEDEDINNISQNDNQHYNLQEKWELILSKLELPSTRMLMSQQAELISISNNEIEIALSPNWESMIKSRKFLIEKTIKKIFGDQIKLIFSSKPTATIDLNNSREKINDTSPPQTSKATKSNLQNNISQEKDYDNSPKNLANFFNGEIIDLNE